MPHLRASWPGSCPRLTTTITATAMSTANTTNANASNTPNEASIAGASFKVFGKPFPQIVAMEPTPSLRFYETRFMPGGCHVPSPTGRIEGGVVFGQ
jgi:hypothetical protein